MITGAAGGIGQALALDMTRRGAAGIALVDFSDRVVQVAREINAEAGRQVAMAYRAETGETSEQTRAERISRVVSERQRAGRRVGAPSNASSGILFGQNM